MNHLYDTINIIESSIENYFNKHKITKISYNGNTIKLNDVFNLYKTTVKQIHNYELQELKNKIEEQGLKLANRISDKTEIYECLSLLFNNENSLEFITLCNTTNVINLQQMFISKYGNLIDLIYPEHRDLYKKFENQLWKLTPNIIGAGAWGRCEIGLALLDKDLVKSTASNHYGDLYHKTLNLHLEIKSCKLHYQGGKINSKAVISGISAFSNHYDFLLTAFSDLHNLNFSLNSSADNYITGSKTTGRSVTYKNFGEAFIQHLNGYIQNININDVQELIKSILFLSIEEDYRGLINTKLYDECIYKITSNHTYINFDKLVLAHSINLFNLYQQVDNIDKIIFINTSSLNFLVISSPEELIEAYKNNILYTNKTFFTFTDIKHVASLNYGIK